MSDGNGISGKIAEVGKGILSSIGEELKKTATSAVSQTTGGQQTPEQQQKEHVEEVEKEQKMKTLRMQLHQQAQMLGVTPPKQPEPEEEKEEAKVGLPDLVVPGASSQPSQPMSVTQAEQKSETGRNFKG